MIIVCDTGPLVAAVAESVGAEAVVTLDHDHLSAPVQGRWELLPDASAL